MAPKSIYLCGTVRLARTMYLAKGGEMGVYLLFENHYIIITTESQKNTGISIDNPSIKQHNT